MKKIIKTTKSHKKPGMFYGFLDNGSIIDLRYEYGKYFILCPEKLIWTNASTKYKFIK